MSILHSFRQLVDPNEARLEEADKRTERQRPRDEGEGGEPPVPHRCRACGYQSNDGSYCPHCLADTMRPLPRQAAPRSPSGDGR